MRRIELDLKGFRKLLKLKNVKIQRKIVTTHLRKGYTSKNISLDVATNTNSILGNVEDWLTFEGDTKIGLKRCYFYAYFTQERLEEMKRFLNEVKTQT